MTKKTAPVQYALHEKLVLKLYVSGMSPKSMEAIENIKTLCSDFRKEDYELEIIDIYQHPEQATQNHIVFSPSLIKVLPLPRKILIGTTYNTDRVKNILGLVSQ
jgi:circadian clock protein KaiB